MYTIFLADRSLCPLSLPPSSKEAGDWAVEDLQSYGVQNSHKETLEVLPRLDLTISTRR